jgi:hypothetical protein
MTIYFYNIIKIEILYPFQRFFVPFYLFIRQLNKMVQKIFGMGINSKKYKFKKI